MNVVCSISCIDPSLVNVYSGTSTTILNKEVHMDVICSISCTDLSLVNVYSGVGKHGKET